MPTMQNNHKKESFKLLQLSDDSKSLTELELPQVTHQRKRKILRKTRNTSPHSRLGGHHAHDASTSSDGLMSSACTSNFGLWIAVVMTCGWLFILSYMTAVVYAENRRLESQLSKLAATSQTVPDELQRWHESSKFLEQNQTATLARIAELDQKYIDLEKDLGTIRVEFKQKYDDSSDHEKVTMLDKNVADFGAQLKALEIDVKDAKERETAMRARFEAANISLHTIEDFVHSANSSIGAAAANPPVTRESVLGLVRNVTDESRTQIDRLTAALGALNYTQDQRTMGLEEDMQSHKKKLDALQENWAHITSQVESIENGLVKLRESKAVDQVSTTAAPIPIAVPSIPSIQKIIEGQKISAGNDTTPTNSVAATNGTSKSPS